MFFKNIAADYMRIHELAEGKNRLARAFFPFTCPGFHALIWYRLIQANRFWRIPVLFYLFALPLRVINTFTQWFWGICIASNCEIGPGLYIAHFGQIFIGVKSMGANCTIGHTVTIGRTEKEHGYPTIGDNVYIAPGAVIIGNIEIGDNVKVGANAVVRKSVPPNSVVVAIPPKIISIAGKEETTEKNNTGGLHPPSSTTGADNQDIPDEPNTIPGDDDSVAQGAASAPVRKPDIGTDGK